MNAIFFSASLDPWHNLAVEEALADRVQPGAVLLYLWRNGPTVVIGRNQNAWKECRIAALEADGGKLARRRTGGGAVYHDPGNLNFSFLCRTADYDPGKQTDVILAACRAFGVQAERTGRNDLVCGGKKFSGCAYLHRDGVSLHHGTLMVRLDLAAAERYLSPPKAKLEGRGVASVRARIGNLTDLVPGLTCDALAERIAAAFEAAFGPAEKGAETDLDGLRVAELETRYADPGWRYGAQDAFSLACEGRFSWGCADLRLTVRRGVIQEARLYTDAMDPDLAPAVGRALTGVTLSPAAIRAALTGKLPAPVSDDLLDLLKGGL